MATVTRLGWRSQSVSSPEDLDSDKRHAVRLELTVYEWADTNAVGQAVTLVRIVSASGETFELYEIIG